MTARTAPSRAALWRDLECGASEDLRLWRTLAAESGGAVGCDIGQGQDQVTLDLAARGVPVDHARQRHAAAGSA